MCKYLGFTLLEVMISLFILSFILLGAVTAGVSAIRAMRSAVYMRQASMLAESMAVYLSANDGRASGYMRDWQHELRQNLPIGRGGVDARQLLVMVSWGGEKLPCRKMKTGLSGCVMVFA